MGDLEACIAKYKSILGFSLYNASQLRDLFNAVQEHSSKAILIILECGIRGKYGISRDTSSMSEQVSELKTLFEGLFFINYSCQ